MFLISAKVIKFQPEMKIIISNYCRSSNPLGKIGESNEEVYFYKQREEQLRKLRKPMLSDAQFVEERIKHHRETIRYHTQMIEDYKSGKKIADVKSKIQDMDKK